MILIEPADPREAQAAALLKASHAMMEELFEPEDNHYLDIDALCQPDIRFFTAREGADVLGTGALAIRNGYGEVKSMFTGPEARGKGVAAALLRQIEDEARSEGLGALKLETGNLLEAAHRLYARHGFEVCGPFGDYAASPASIFMSKTL